MSTVEGRGVIMAVHRRHVVCGAREKNIGGSNLQKVLYVKNEGGVS